MLGGIVIIAASLVFLGYCVIVLEHDIREHRRNRTIAQTEIPLFRNREKHDVRQKKQTRSVNRRARPKRGAA